MVLIDAGTRYEHVQIIRCDIKPGSAERSRDVENGPNFRKKSKG
jgi:hypothetical protein